MPGIDALLHTVTGLLITVCGFFINRMLHEKDKFQDQINHSLKGMDIRMRFVESGAAVSETRYEVQVAQLVNLNEAVADVRTHMVRREDLNALVSYVKDK